MNQDSTGAQEIITLAGVRERMAAYEEECKRKQEVKSKTKITLFQVEDGKLHDSFSHSNSGDYQSDDHSNIREHTSTGTFDFDASGDEQERPEGDSHDNDNTNDDDDKSVGADELDLEPGPHGSSSAFDYSSRPDLFRGDSFGSSGDEAEQQQQRSNKEPEEKTPEQIQKDQKEEEVKKTFTMLLEKEFDQKTSASSPVILQSFSSLQKRYLSAVTALRPQTFSTDASSTSKQNIKAELREEAIRKDRFNSLKSSYNAYAEAAQDKRENVEDIQVEEEIEKVEDEVVEEWVDYAEKAVEKVEILVESAAADGAETSEEDAADDMAEMERWREEAKKLKQEAAERKQRKAEQDAYRAKRKEKAKERAAKRAEYLKQKKERAEKKAETEAAAAADEEETQEQDQASTAEDKQLQEEQEAADQKALEDRIMAQQEAEEAEKRQAQQAAVAAHEAEIEAKMKEQKEAEPAAEEQVDQAKKKKSDHHDKKKGDKKKKKEKKDKHHKKTGDEGGDGSDVEVDEKFPKNLDGSIWKNVLKFWTNKPKSLKEKGSKVIMSSVPGSDCFRRSRDSVNDNASFYWHKVEGDFDCVVHIKGDLTRPYDKAGIMLRVDEKNWVMSGVEYFGEQLNNACCITREISDWSLAPLPEQAKKGCWFCVKRIGNKVESFYSMDTKNWIQTRQGLFTEAATLKVGIATGSPMGESFKVTFDRFWLKKKQRAQV